MITLDTPQQPLPLSISSFGGTHLLTKLKAKFSWAHWACLSATPSNSMEQYILMCICPPTVAAQRKTKLDIISQKLELFRVTLIFLKILFNISMIMSFLITIWRPVIQDNLLLWTISLI